MDGDEVLGAGSRSASANFRASHARLTRVPEKSARRCLDAADRGRLRARDSTCLRASRAVRLQVAGQPRACSASPAQALHTETAWRVFPVEEAQSAQPQAEETLTLQLVRGQSRIRLASATLATRSLKVLPVTIRRVLLVEHRCRFPAKGSTACWARR